MWHACSHVCNERDCLQEALLPLHRACRAIRSVHITAGHVCREDANHAFNLALIDFIATSTNTKLRAAV